MNVSVPIPPSGTSRVSPFFSVVIPVFNREAEVLRALASCLNQSHFSFEIVAVDDGSTDHSLDVLKSVGDSRLRVIGHETNRGIYPARATGVANAKGKWIVFLDSDDELLPDALAMIYGYVIADKELRDRYGFVYRIDQGGKSPDPLPIEGQILDYEGYLRWLETIRKSDYVQCVRKDTFDNVPLSQGRDLYELLYHLNFARRYVTLLCTLEIAILHTDSSNRSSNLGLLERLDKIRREAPGGVSAIEEILRLHGKDLQHFAPIAYSRFSKLRGMFHLLAGNRKRGLHYILRYLRMRPFSAEGWVILLAGMAGARMLSLAKALKRR